MKKISVVVPMYCEEKMVDEFYKKITEILNDIKNYEYEIICVNDGSKDRTLELLKNIAEKDKKLKIISFTRNFGHQNAVTAGLKYITGDCGIIIDADLQDPPSAIVDMVKLWEDGNDIVYGKRKVREGESKFKILSAKMFYTVLNSLSDIEIPRDTGDFRLVDRKVIDVVNALPEHNKFLRGLFSWVGFEQKEYLYERKERYAGTTKYPINKMIKLALDGIIGFSTKPLKIVGTIGIISIVISIMVLIYALISYAFSLNNLMHGWTSIIVTITFFSGVQLLSIWIMSEYIERIYDECIGRPQYIVKELINIE